MSRYNLSQSVPDTVAPLVCAAEKEISRILSILESDTGMIIDNIEVRNIEVTTNSDTRPRWLRRVKIEIQRHNYLEWEV